MGVVLPQPIQFGKYTLFERIGRGGMADVFKARVQGPAGFERVFVVKRILPHLSDDPQFNKMFVEEAKMSARLNHPNIVQVFELGAVDSEYFISMEYVRGRDLAETMRTLWARVGPPRPELVAYIGREMSRALDYAHGLVGDDGRPIGMIHRDVSPSNVMLSYEGAVKLLDFGIAKALGGDQKDEGTQRGTLKGKFAYMAPEQTQGNDVDRRIDVFASGIVLHEMLTGRRLFKGENDLQTVEKVRQCDVPPPSLQNPLCPPELDAIVLKALARNRDERFQTSGDVADALDDIVHHTRFQPTHLAQLMRDLFPGEAGSGEIRSSTGSVRVSQPMTGSNSRPYSTMRSPTVPPVSVSVSRSGSSSAPMDPPIAMQAPEMPKPFFQRPAVILTLLVLGIGGGIGGGIAFMRSTTPAPVAGAGANARGVKDGPVKIRVDSIPEGAEVFEKGKTVLLCKTPCMATINWKADNPSVLVLRKAGYQDVEKDVRPPLGVFATLKIAYGSPGAHPEPKTPAPTPQVTPPPSPTPVVTPPPSSASPPPAEPTPPATGREHTRGDSRGTPAANEDPFAPSATPTPGTRSRRRSGTGKTGQQGSDLVNPF